MADSFSRDDGADTNGAVRTFLGLLVTGFAGIAAPAIVDAATVRAIIAVCFAIGFAVIAFFWPTISTRGPARLVRTSRQLASSGWAWLLATLVVMFVIGEPWSAPLYDRLKGGLFSSGVPAEAVPLFDEQDLGPAKGPIEPAGEVTEERHERGIVLWSRPTMTHYVLLEAVGNKLIRYPDVNPESGYDSTADARKALNYSANGCPPLLGVARLWKTQPGLAGRLAERMSFDAYKTGVFYRLYRDGLKIGPVPTSAVDTDGVVVAINERANTFSLATADGLKAPKGEPRHQNRKCP